MLNTLTIFFPNVAQRLTAGLPDLTDSYSAFSNKCISFYQKLHITPGAQVLNEVDPTFINKELKKLAPCKSVGLDDISPRFLKDGADELTNIITFLVNLSIKSKTVPDSAKQAKVLPLHKKNSKLEVGNYRPVSVLTSISKILEKAVYSQVEDHCRNKKLLFELQSGFRGKYSTDTCLIYLHDLIRSEISNGNVVGLMLLDVQKAFDSVDHHHLCEKIRLVGLDPQWFKSYLHNRKQNVFINGFPSGYETIKTGVPQGSILGPWFYLIFSNDIPNCIESTNTKLLLYADDTILMASNRKPDLVAQELSSALSNCHQWFTNNKLVMHSGKTETILITSNRKKHLQKFYNIKHGDQVIKPSDSVKYLGLKIDRTLSGQEIVNSVLSKCNARLKFMYRFKDVLDLKTKKLLTSALLQCHFDYASTAWYFSLTKFLKNKLQVAQNKVVRYILDLHPRTHIGQNELDRVGILSIEDRARQLMLNHVYDIYNGSAPSYLQSKF